MKSFKASDLKRRSRPIGLTMADMLEIDPLGATYTFVNNDAHTATHIASGVLYAHASVKWPVTRCYFGDSLEAALMRGDLGVEEPHALKLPEEALEVPALVCEWGDKHIVADGSHRLWRRWKRGDQWFPAYVIPEEAWREYEITDVPGGAAYWDDFNRTVETRALDEQLMRDPELAGLLLKLLKAL
jgi:hypothetical protein